MQHVLKYAVLLFYLVVIIWFYFTFCISLDVIGC